MQTVDLIAMISGLTAVALIGFASFLAHTQGGRAGNLDNELFRTDVSVTARHGPHGFNVVQAIARARD